MSATRHWLIQVLMPFTTPPISFCKLTSKYDETFDDALYFIECNGLDIDGAPNAKAVENATQLAYMRSCRDKLRDAGGTVASYYNEATIDVRCVSITLETKVAPPSKLKFQKNSDSLLDFVREARLAVAHNNSPASQQKHSAKRRVTPGDIAEAAMQRATKRKTNK